MTDSAAPSVKSVRLPCFMEAKFRQQSERLKGVLDPGRWDFHRESGCRSGLWTGKATVKRVHDKVIRKDLCELPSAHRFVRVCAVTLVTKNQHGVHDVDANQGGEETKPTVRGDPLLLEGEFRLPQLIVLVQLVETQEVSRCQINEYACHLLS